jgi:hypothetical protein
LCAEPVYHPDGRDLRIEFCNLSVLSSPAGGLFDLCFEKEIHEIADAMVANGMKALNYSLILLDDCEGWKEGKYRLSY